MKKFNLNRIMFNNKNNKNKSNNKMNNKSNNMKNFMKNSMKNLKLRIHNDYYKYECSYFE